MNNKKPHLASHTSPPLMILLPSLLHKLAYDHRHIIGKTKQNCGQLQIQACGFEFAHIVLRFGHVPLNSVFKLGFPCVT